jgi:hypothetical protein
MPSSRAMTAPDVHRAGIDPARPHQTAPEGVSRVLAVEASANKPQKRTFRPLLDIIVVSKGTQVRGASAVKLPRRNFLHLAADASTLD